MSPSSLDEAGDIYTAQRLSLPIRKPKKQRADFLQTNCIRSRTRSSSELSHTYIHHPFNACCHACPEEDAGANDLVLQQLGLTRAPPLWLWFTWQQSGGTRQHSQQLLQSEKGGEKKKSEAGGFSFPGQVVQETPVFAYQTTETFAYRACQTTKADIYKLVSCPKWDAVTLSCAGILWIDTCLQLIWAQLHVNTNMHCLPWRVLLEA